MSTGALDIKQIMDIIPHRSPFLLIDRVEEMEAGKSITAKKCVSYGEPFFAGHFPAEPVMPGVLIIEALAQAGAVLCLSAEQNRGKLAFFAGIDKARFRDKVVPGDVLTLKVELLNMKGSIGRADAKAYKDEKVVAEAVITFAIADAPDREKDN